MDIMIILRIFIFSPIAAYIIIFGLFYLHRHLFKLNTSLSECMGRCFKWGIATAGASLVIFILWMVWSYITTKQDNGQAPLAWIFGFGPISFMIGSIIGFMMWCKSNLLNEANAPKSRRPKFWTPW